MRRKHHRWLLLLLLLAACTAPAPPPAPTALARTTITFAASAGEGPGYAPLLAQFARANPNVQVQLVALANDAHELAQVARAADVALVPQAILGGADPALLRDLLPLIDADASFVRSDYFATALQPQASSGRLALLPRTLAVPLLRYHRDRWQAAGLAPPANTWAWPDLLAAATQLATTTNRSTPQYGLYDPGDLALRGELAAAGLTLADLAAPPQLTTPAVAAVLTRVAGYAQAGAVYAAPAAGSDSAALTQLIRAGQLALWPADLPLGAAPLPFATGLASYPANLNRPVRPADGYVISAGTQHPDAAWRLVAFLSQQPVAAPLQPALAASQIPARRTLASQQGYWQALDAEATQAVQATLERTTAPEPAAQRAVAVALQEALASVRAGTPASTALAQAEQTLATALATQAGALPTSVAPPPVATPLSDTRPAGVTQITFAISDYGDGQIPRIATQFNTSQAEVAVAITVRDSQGTPSYDAVAAAADCFIWRPPMASEISATLDLQPLVDADAAFRLDDYPAAFVSPFQHNGGLYGLPDQVRLQHLYYQPALFDAAGLPYPDASWTLAQFADTAARLTKRQGTPPTYGFAVTGMHPWVLGFVLDRFGAPTITGQGLAAQPNFSDPQVLAAVRYYLDLLEAAAPPTRLNGYRPDAMDDDRALIGQVEGGQVAMWLDVGVQRTDPLGSDQANPPAVAAPPLGGSQLSRNDFSVSGLMIAANTPHAAACWQWLKYLSAAAARVEIEDVLPARQSVAQSAAFLQQAPPGSAAAYSALLPALQRPLSATMQPGLVDTAEFDDYWFFRAVDRALQGKDLERELQVAQTLTEQYLACARSGGERAACAKQVDPQYQGWALP